MSARVRHRWKTATVAAGTGLASVFVPMSYDEAYWLGVAKMVESGRVLYEGAIDNKTPPVYGLVWLLDALPGPYEIWRSVFIGGVAALLTLGLSRLNVQRDERHPWVGPVLALAVVVLAEFQAAVELTAVVLLTWALAWEHGRQRPVLRAVGLLGAVAFDPRTILLLPGALLLLRDRLPDGATRQVSLLVGAGLVTGMTAVLLLPGPRYALVELNLGSRFTDLRPSIGEMLLSSLVAIVVFLPLLLVVNIKRGDHRMWIFTLGAVIIPLASLLGIPHYWIYLAPAIALLPARMSTTVGSPAIALLVITGFLPGVVNVTRSVALHGELVAESSRIAGILSSQLQSGDRYVLFGALPHLVVELPAQNAMSAPTSHYAAAGGSRSDRYLAELGDALTGAAAVVDDGGLSVPREHVFAAHRPTRDLIDSRLADYRCVREIGGITVHLREDRCPR